MQAITTEPSGIFTARPEDFFNFLGIVHIWQMGDRHEEVIHDRDIAGHHPTLTKTCIK